MVRVTTGLPDLSRMGDLALTGLVRRVRRWAHVAERVAGQETAFGRWERDRSSEEAGARDAMVNCAGSRM